jgi:molybdopterin/thiamine biosynthesis adenylyltransferase/rhodanese-related sulfurtransferase
MMDRYSRQIMLPQVGAQGQERLFAAHVVVLGAGGLGSPVLAYLAGAGVGRLTIVDGDRVEENNLHRQPLFNMRDIDLPKAMTARLALTARNPDCTIEAIQEHADPANISELIVGADIVVDAADSFALTYIASDACRDAGIPFVSASVLGASGYAGGFCASAPSYRAVFPDMPEQAASCSTDGVFGPVVGMLGSLQAQMVLGILLGLSPSPLGQMVTLDLNTYRFSSFRFDTAQEPRHGFRFISQEHFEAEDVVVDLRETREAPTPVLPSALRFTVDDLNTDKVPEIQKHKRLVLCCRSGVRSWKAARHFHSLGYRNIAVHAAG